MSRPRRFVRRFCAGRPSAWNRPFDRVHVGAVRWQISQFGSGRLYELLEPGSLVARQIVHDDDVAFREGGDETFYHPFLERGSVDRPVEGLLRHEAAKAQAATRSLSCDGHAERRCGPLAAPTASRLRAMFVEAQVSSMNTRRVGSRSSCPANQSRRCLKTSERCCSSAGADFF